MKASLKSNHDYYARLRALLESPREEAGLHRAIVDTPFNDRLTAAVLGLGITVLLLKKGKLIERIALSDTDQAKGAVRVSAKPFKEIKVPADDSENFVARCIATGQPQHTDDWQYLFIPALTAEEARFNQAGAGIACSFVYPLKKAKGAMIFSYFTPLEEIGPEHRDYMKNYASMVDDALSRQQ